MDNIKKPLCSSPANMVEVIAQGYRTCCKLPIIHGCESLEAFAESDYTQALIKAHAEHDLINIPATCRRCLDEKDEYRNYTDVEGFALTELNMSYDYTCGLSCIMCYNSEKRFKLYSKIGDEHLVIPVLPPNREFQKNIGIFKVLEQHKETLTTVSLLGGDPAMNPDLPRFLEELPEHVKLVYHHNGDRNTLVDGSKLSDRLSKFKDLHVAFSLDGDFEFNTYHRVGLKPSKFIENYKDIVENTNAYTSVIYTLTNLSILRLSKSIPDLEYLASIGRGFGVKLNSADTPRFLAPQNLPFKLRRDVLHELKGMTETYAEGSIGHYLSERALYLLTSRIGSKLYWDEFLIDRKKTDEFHGMSPLQWLPELKPYWYV